MKWEEQWEFGKYNLDARLRARESIETSQVGEMVLTGSLRAPVNSVQDNTGGGSSVGSRSSGHGARGKEPRVRFPPWAIFSEGERGRVDWPEPAPRGSWIIAELCKWKIDCVG